MRDGSLSAPNIAETETAEKIMKNIRIQQGCLAVAGIVAAGSLVYTALLHKRRTKTCKTLEEAAKDLADPVDENNDILCREIRVARDYNKNHLLNQTLVVGRTGSGKSFSYVGPNLMQMNASYIVNDPDGQYMKEYGALLAYHGYEIMCLNMADPDKSNHYNPFRHIQTERDICILAEAICPDCAGKFDRSEMILISALIAYLHNHAEESMRNLSALAQILREAQKESCQESLSDSYLDSLFAEIAEKDPNGFAVREYKDFKIAAGSTERTAIAKAYARLMVFEEPKARMLTDTDDLDFDAFGSKKTALFVIPDEGSLSCLSSVCYSQLIEHFDCATESYEATHLSVILDADRHVIKTFYADNNADAATAAENYFERAKQGTIHFCENRNRWELLTPDGEIVLWRGAEEAAQAAFNALKCGSVMQSVYALKTIYKCQLPMTEVTGLS